MQHHQDRSPYSLAANDSSDHPDEDFDVSPTEDAETEIPDEVGNTRSSCPPSKKVKSEEMETEIVHPGMWYIQMAFVGPGVYFWRALFRSYCTRC